MSQPVLDEIYQRAQMTVGKGAGETEVTRDSRKARHSVERRCYFKAGHLSGRGGMDVCVTSETGRVPVGWPILESTRTALLGI
jgi:hypothetical protein